MLFLACNSFSFCSEIQLRTSNRAFFPNSNSSSPDDGPIPKPQFSAVFIRKKMEIWLVTRWVEQFDRVCLAFCFMQFHVSRFEIPPIHVRLDSGIGNSSCQFVVHLQALLQFIQSLLAGIHFSFFFKHVFLYFFRWDEEKVVFILSELQLRNPIQFINACWLVLERILSTLPKLMR